jgi:hypothetical protein
VDTLEDKYKERIVLGLCLRLHPAGFTRSLAHRSIMSLNLYHLSVPIYTRALSCMLNVLKKGEKWADENGVPHQKLVSMAQYIEQRLGR